MSFEQLGMEDMDLEQALEGMYQTKSTILVFVEFKNSLYTFL